MKKHLFFFTVLIFSKALVNEVRASLQYPVVVSTWPFLEAVRAAWNAVDGGFSAVDAVVEGCSACEKLRCDGTVGPGGSPDENGETTLDAMVMDGVTMEVGAVAAMRYVPEGIKAAKLVLEYTKHTMLVGDQASAFAISMGLPGPTNLSSVESIEKWTKWKDSSCQPNFRKNVIPRDSCGPFHPNGPSIRRCLMDNELRPNEFGSVNVGLHSHDTISMAVIDQIGRIAVGTSTNGATFKIPGRDHSRLKREEVETNYIMLWRDMPFIQGCLNKVKQFINISKIVMKSLRLDLSIKEVTKVPSRIVEVTQAGSDIASIKKNLELCKCLIYSADNTNPQKYRVGDGPIAGSSAYADAEVGACGATGDGDIMMRFLPCYQAVENMRLGMEPKLAAKDAISRIARKYPNFIGALFAVNRNGTHAGACHGWTFQYSVRNPGMNDVKVFTVHPQ